MSKCLDSVLRVSKSTEEELNPTLMADRQNKLSIKVLMSGSKETTKMLPLSIENSDKKFRSRWLLWRSHGPRLLWSRCKTS